MSFPAAFSVFFLVLISKPTYAVDELILPDYKGEMVEVENGAESIKLPFSEGLSFVVAFSSGQFATIANRNKASNTYNEQISCYGDFDHVVNRVEFNVIQLCRTHWKQLPLCAYIDLPFTDKPYIYGISLSPWRSSDRDPGSPFDDFVNSLTPFQGNGDYGDFRLYESESYSFCNHNRKKVICDFYAKMHGDYIFKITLTNFVFNADKYSIFERDMKKSIDRIVSSVNEWKK